MTDEQKQAREKAVGFAKGETTEADDAN